MIAFPSRREGHPLDPEHGRQQQNVGRAFFEVAGRFPESVAVRHGAGLTTYGALAGQACAWMAALDREGILPSDRVVIGPGPAERLIPAMLACMAAEVMFVVVEEAWPRHHRGEIASDLGARWNLAGESGEAEAIGLRDLLPGPSLGPVQQPGMRNGIRDACLFYTGGTTGKPKGVLQTHANILHEAEVHQSTHRLGPGDRLSGLYPLAAAGCVRDVFAALLSGAEYVPLPLRGGSWDWLTRELIARSVTIFHAVPPVFRAWAGSLPPGTVFPAVRLVFLAGDTVRREDVRRCREVFPQAPFYTGLGCSEASSLYVHRLIEPDDPLEVPLASGVPVPGKRVGIIEGEIVVEGDYLSPGYWQRPDQDRIRFKDGPHGRRLFTGDLGRFDSMGRLCHLGRADRRVKLNGGAVDLDVVGALLRKAPGVLEARVEMKERAGEKIPVAYLVANAKVREADLRRMLDHMAFAIPMWFHRLEAFPLTATGKVDVPALPVPWNGAETTFSGSSDREGGVRALFERLLGRPVEDDDTDFRQLGGDSLGLIRLATDFSRTFGRAIGPADFQACLSVRTLTALAGKSQQSSPDPDWPSHWFAAAAAWEMPAAAARMPGFPGWRLDGKKEEQEDIALVWLAVGTFDAVIPMHLSGKRTVYVIPSGNLIMPTAAGEIARWLPAVVAALRRSLGRRPVVIGGFCASGILAVAWAAELEKQGTTVAGVVAIDSPANAALCQRWYLAVLGWHEWLRTARSRGWLAGLQRKARSFARRLASAPGDKGMVAGSHRFALEELPAWAGPVRLHMSTQAWRSRWLLGSAFGWCPVKFPGVEIHRIAGSHFNCLSVNPGELLLPADDRLFQSPPYAS